VSAFSFGAGAFESMRSALKRSERRPLTGVTQGGSSRSNAGAKSAASDGSLHDWTDQLKPETDE